MSAPTETALDFAGLLELLSFTDGEFVSVIYWDIDDTPHTAVGSPGKAPAYADKLPDTANVFFGVNPVKGPRRKNAGRGTEADITRLAALVCDLDFKPGGCGSRDVALAIVAELGIILDTRASVIVDSGHGLHAYWPISDGQIAGGDITAARALLKRWGRLVEHIAGDHNVHADNVFDLARVMRLPGSHNNKSSGNGEAPILVTAQPQPGGPLIMTEVDERLTEHGIEERDDDRAAAAKEISPPADWTFADDYRPARPTCPYVGKMINAWTTDRPKPGGSRNHFVYDRYIRLFCAYRNGCITADDYKRARQTLADLLTELVSTIEPRRQPRKFEIREMNKYGIKLVASKTDEQVSDELGDHDHEPQPEPKPPPAQPIPLDAAHKVFCKWLGKDYDTDALDLCLSAAAVEKLDGDPLWVLIVSGSGNAKTETVQPFHSIGGIVVGSISSEAALLSATPQRERAKKATGGLLRKLGDHGLLVIKDVTSILSMDHITRGRVLSALREIYDGHWVRDVGAEGGRTIPWIGRITVIGAVTTAWDTHHAVIAKMGDRFTLLRMNSRNKEPRKAAGRRSISNTGDETTMRKELAAAVAGVIAGMNTKPIRLTEKESGIIVEAADLTTLARTGVEADYRGNIIDAHDPEMPTRFAKQLAQVVRGAVAIGMDRTDALVLAIRCARESMPPMRLAIIDDLSKYPHSSTQEVRKRLDKPRTTVDRQLQALHMLGVLTCDEVEYGPDGDRFRWYYTLAADIDPETLDPSKVAQKS